MTVHKVAAATNKKSVPKKPMYTLGRRRPTSSICCSMPVTTISSRFCQRDRARSVESLRVMSLEPTTRINIKPHVNTMVPLSLKKPSCQKIISSGLRRRAGLLYRFRLMLFRQAGQPCHELARHDKADKTGQQTRPIAARNKVEPSQCQSQAQQQTGQDPKRRFG